MKVKISKYVFLVVLFLFSCKKTDGQKIEKQISEINKLDQLIPKNQKIESKEEIDIDGDNIKETIITATDSNTTNAYEYWFKNGKILYQFSYPWSSINIKWLINLDDDKQFEIVRAQGYEDGVDYIIYDIQNGKQIPVLAFNPALNDNRNPNQIFWAYPNDIAKLNIANGKLEASTNNDFQREDEYFIPKDQAELPFIFFNGKTTQPDMKLTDLKKSQFYTLQQLIALVSIKNNQNKADSTTWNGKYSGSFLRLKDEAADPRAMGQINLEINGKRATLKIDSYVENVQKNLEVVTESKEELKLKDLSTGKILTISQKSGKIMMKGELMESIAKTSDQYEIEKII